MNRHCTYANSLSFLPPYCVNNCNAIIMLSVLFVVVFRCVKQLIAMQCQCMQIVIIVGVINIDHVLSVLYQHIRADCVMSHRTIVNTFNTNTSELRTVHILGVSCSDTCSSGYIYINTT